MKTRLQQLTVSEFSDLVSGDANVLLSEGESVSPAEQAVAARNIIFEYREISAESEYKKYLALVVETLRVRTEYIIYSMCQALAAVEQTQDIRAILLSVGINAGDMPPQRLYAEVKSRFAKAQYDVERLKAEMPVSDEVRDVRKAFDEQTAAMMAHYKFQIDTSTMAATLYAHLVARFNREVKAQMSALKKK